MPLHRVDPALQVEAVVNAVAIVGIMDRGVHIVGQMVVVDYLPENMISMLCKTHK
jgi:hypothetical protein